MAGGRPRESLKQRFYSKVLINPTDPDGCWEWAGSKLIDGYGKLNRPGRNAGTLRAHRVAWLLLRDEQLPTEIDHRCRNRGCVNPEHLRPVTRSENNQNVDKRANNSTGYRGVVLHKRVNRYQGRVGHRGKSISCGYFDTAEEAAEAAKAKRLELFTHNEMDRL